MSLENVGAQLPHTLTAIPYCRDLVVPINTAPWNAGPETVRCMIAVKRTHTVVLNAREALPRTSSVADLQILLLVSETGGQNSVAAGAGARDVDRVHFS